MEHLAYSRKQNKTKNSACHVGTMMGEKGRVGTFRGVDFPLHNTRYI